MIKNYLLIAMRKLAKQRIYALLNVLGLGMSVGCSILIFLLLRHHTGFDTYHPRGEQIFRVVMDVKTENVMPFRGVPNPMARALREECPIVEKSAMRSAEAEVLISIPNASGGKDKYKEVEKFAWTEPEYFEILNLPMVRGDYHALSEPNTVVLSERIARKYFGNSEAIGRTIRHNNKLDLRVVGIMKDLPKQTDYKHEILSSWITYGQVAGNAEELNKWDGARGENYCFALLKPGHSVAEMDPVMADFRRRHPHPESADLFQYKAMPMLGLHFDTDYGAGMDKKYLWALGLIGFFLLITACVNFVNMATAQALTRAREVGVRKSLGSTRMQLFWQFMAETGLIVFSALLVGALLAWQGLPFLNAWMKEDLDINASLAGSLGIFILILGILLTFLAGFYPGLMQSGFKPVISMKGAGETPKAGGFPLRRVLVTTQFAISQMLIIGAAVITAQLQFSKDADWGFRPGAVLTLDVPEKAKMKTLKQELSALSGVKSVSLCYMPPASSSNNHNGIQFDNRPKGEAWLLNDKPADENYLETFGLQLVAGRNLVPSDTFWEVVVNETFVKKLNLPTPEDVLNRKVVMGGVAGTIVGVVHDFHNWSMAEPIAPIALSSRSSSYLTCAIQLQSGNPAPTLNQIQEVWEKQFPEHYYEKHFMDESLEQFMETEIMIMRLVRFFAGIAVLIGCLGLYGLASFMVMRKRKEVGIRKTLGASMGGILWLFGKEYARLIFIAFLIAAPFAWWAMNGWLQDYAYRISIGFGIFAASFLLTLAIAVLTVGVQSLRAALANPVNALKSE